MSRYSRNKPRLAARRSLQAKSSQRRASPPPKRHSPVTQAKAAADTHALVNVPYGIRIIGLPESHAEKLFGKGGVNSATLQSLEGTKAFIRTKYGSFVVQRRFVQPAAAHKADISPTKSLKLSYPAPQWVQIAPGIEILK